MKFADKTPMAVDSNPLQAEAHYAEPSEVNVIEATRSQSKRPGITMVEVSKDHINMPIFGRFSGNLSRKTIEAVQKAVESPKLETAEAQKTGPKSSSHLATVQGQTENLEIQMKQLTLAKIGRASCRERV